MYVVNGFQDFPRDKRELVSRAELRMRISPAEVNYYQPRNAFQFSLISVSSTTE